MSKLANIKEILTKVDAQYLISAKEGDFVLIPLNEYLALKRSQKTPENLTDSGYVDRINRDIAHASLEEIEENTQVQWPEKDKPIYLEPINELLKD